MSSLAPRDGRPRSAAALTEAATRLPPGRVSTTSVLELRWKASTAGRACRAHWLALAGFVLAFGSPVADAQRPTFALGDGPWTYTTFEQDTRIRVSVVTRDLSRPWSMAFLPGSSDTAMPMGDALITERAGRVRLFSDGRLGVASIADLSELNVDQLFDVALHPDFESNAYVYLSYIKAGVSPSADEGFWATTAVARGRFDGRTVTDIEDVFVADAWHRNRGGDAASLEFGADGRLYLSSSHRRDPDVPQRLDSHIGKVLRLDDGGSAPADNPFVDRIGALPEIYTYGHRTIMDFAVHPQTGRLWEAENGPQGGDEVNVLRGGGDYGWPAVTYGREYDGSVAVPGPAREGMIAPELFWVPSITISSMSFYTGDAFPAWRNNLLVGAMIEGRIPGTGHIERIVFNEQGEVRRERLLDDLQQRIRFVGQGPDGLIYLLTDDDAGALLRIEPGTSGAGESGTPASVEPREDVLFADQDCADCHRLDSRSVGPSYREIAGRYGAGDIDVLARRIVEGGVGEWGEVPMTAHSGISVARAREMVSEILGLAAGVR